VLFQVKRGAIFQFTVVPFYFCLISNYFRFVMHIYL